MADAFGKNSADQFQLVGDDNVNAVEVNSNKEVRVHGTPEQGVSAILTLTTTAQELKVGGSALPLRKYIEMQALDKNVKWGYDISCPFDLFKNQFFALPAGPGCVVYLKASVGTADIAVSEK